MHAIYKHKLCPYFVLRYACLQFALEFTRIFNRLITFHTGIINDKSVRQILRLKTVIIKQSKCVKNIKEYKTCRGEKNKIKKQQHST